MAAKPTLEPTPALEEEQEEIDEGEESDIYEVEDDSDDGVYQREEDEEDEVNEGEVGEPEKLIALLLGKQNGTTRTEESESDEEDDEEDEEYHEDGQGTAENPIDVESVTVVAGSKRGVDVLTDGDASEDENDDEAGGETVAKKARV